MNWKRIKCKLTGGCKFKPGTTECHVDENDMVTITETCMKCGKKFTIVAPMRAFVRLAEDSHADMYEGIDGKFYKKTW